jgi:hypothetical protein
MKALSMDVEQEFSKEDFAPSVNYYPHPGQQRLHESTAKYRFLAPGARWGKTTAASFEAMFGLLPPNQKVWVVSNTYEQARMCWSGAANGNVTPEGEVVCGFANYFPELISEKSDSRMYLKLKNGSELMGKSADNADSLLGVGLDAVIFDECPLASGRIWEEYLRPRLIDRDGWALLLGTPKGKGWYYHAFLKGLNPTQGNQGNYYAQEGSVFENIRLPPKVLSDLLAQKPDWPPKAWDQEVLGKFISDQGAVFTNPRGLVKGEAVKDLNWPWAAHIEKPLAGQAYAGGCDLAKHQDWTIITVLDMTGHCVFWAQVPQETNWPITKDFIKRVSEYYNKCTMYTDASGIGDPIVDDLIQMNVAVYGVPTAQQKIPLIDALVVATSNDRINFPELPILINELEIFEHTKSETGRDKYNAPPTFHDDCFTAGTLILTPFGQVPIELLEPGDWVMTRNGPRPIGAVRSQVKPVINRFGLTGTPDHPVFTAQGITKLINVKDTTITYIWNPKSLSMEESRIGDTRIQSDGSFEFTTGIMENGKHRLSPCIASCGKTISAQYQGEWSSTIKTGIPSTTRLRTSNSCPAMSMPRTILHPNSVSVLPTNSRTRGKLGRPQNPWHVIGEAGSLENEERKTSDSSVKHLNMNMFADSVERNSSANELRKRVGAVKNVIGNTYEFPAKQKSIANATGRERVYNLQVMGTPEYFANDVLVHNCVISLALAWRGIGGGPSWAVPSEGL